MSDPLSDAAASSNAYAQQQAQRTIADEAKEAADIARLQSEIDSLDARVSALENSDPPPPPPPPTPSGIAAPQPPTAYQLPAGAKMVSTSAGLASALASTTASDIVLADGTYDQASAFASKAAHRVYAQNLGKAVLTAGITVQYGGILQGLTFNIPSSSKAAGSACVRRDFMPAAPLQILDCTFEGNWAVAYGIIDYSPDGASYQRLVFSHFTDVGLRSSNNKAVSYGSATPKIQAISDISIDGVSRAVPGSSNGTAEAGLFIGHPVLNPVARIKTRNVSWSGVETVNNAWDTTFTDMDIDMTGPKMSDGVGVYAEHYSLHNTYQNSTIRAKTGLNGEWDHGTIGTAGCRNCVITGVTFDGTGISHSAGVYLDEGSESNTITNCTFIGQTWAAIGAYLNVGTNSFDVGNTYQLPAGVPQFSTNHI